MAALPIVYIFKKKLKDELRISFVPPAEETKPYSGGFRGHSLPTEGTTVSPIMIVTERN